MLPERVRSVSVRYRNQMGSRTTSSRARLIDPIRGPHPEEIKAAVRKRGSSLAELSRQHGYAADSARKALTRPWPAVERLIADYLGTDPWLLWPERYGADCQPLRGKPVARRSVSVRRKGGSK